MKLFKVRVLFFLCLFANFMSINIPHKNSVLGFLNSLFTPKPNSFKKEYSFKEKSYLISKYKNLPEEKENSPPTAENSPSDAVKDGKTEANNGIISQAWLTISSPDFKNKQKYPPIPLGNGGNLEITTNDKYFRVNESFKEGANEPPSNLHFWFRLSSDNNLYYTNTKSDIQVMGSFKINSIKDVMISQNDPNCFHLKKTSEDYLLCADDAKTRNVWYCDLAEYIEKSDPSCNPDKNEKEGDKAIFDVVKTKIENKTIQPIILVPLPAKHCNDKWTYNNNGSDWECTCAEGKEQSPIDLPLSESAIESSVRPLFQFDEVLADMSVFSTTGETYTHQHVEIKYYSNSLRIFHDQFGKIVTLDGSSYTCQEIVFHTPAEHTINNRKYDLELQLICYGQSKGDIAKQVVMSFLFVKTPGIYNKFLDDIDLFNLPNPSHKSEIIKNNLFLPKIFYTADNEDIPVLKPFSFFTYQGSITFPPCTERTIHYVVSDPIPLGSTSLDMIKEAIKLPDFKDEKGNIISNSSEPTNNRVTQPRNDRPVFHWNHKKYCSEPIQKSEIKPTGHYEKVPRKVTEYFFVNGEKPSGLPDSYVVSETEALG